MAGKIQFFLASCANEAKIVPIFLCPGRIAFILQPQMVQGLQLSQRLTQSLVLSPQLQQSLALLQAPTLELKALVEQELEQNPVLEEVADAGNRIGSDKPVRRRRTTRPPSRRLKPPRSRAPRRPADDFQAEFERLVQLDQEWRDHFSQTNTPIRRSPRRRKSASSCSTRSRRERRWRKHLMEQVRDTDLTEEQRGHRRTDHRQH